VYELDAEGGFPMSDTFDLLFLTTKPGHMPHRPIAHIYVKSWSGNDYGGKGKDKVLVGAECVSPREIKLQIAQMKRELDEVGRKAIREYAAAVRAGLG
jgi:hypothetical protein